MKKSTFFISDLHLSEESPQTTRVFLSFLHSIKERCASLYVVGDFFDYWVGPKQIKRPYYRMLLTELSRFQGQGEREVFLIRGNRDLYLGPYMEKGWGIRVLEDMETLHMAGKTVCLTHGDLLCSNDRKYHLARRVLRSPLVRFALQALPSGAGLFLAKGYRGHSSRVVSNKSFRERELVFSKIRDYFLKGMDVIICGHVHKARKFCFSHEGRKGVLFTLGLWGNKGSYIEWNGDFMLQEFVPEDLSGQEE